MNIFNQSQKIKAMLSIKLLENECPVLEISGKTIELQTLLARLVQALLKNNVMNKNDISVAVISGMADKQIMKTGKFELKDYIKTFFPSSEFEVVKIKNRKDFNKIVNKAMKMKGDKE